MKVLLVDAESPFSRAVAYCLVKAGFKVCGASREAVPPTFRLSRYCAAYRRVRDVPAILEFAREQHVDLIMATGLDGLRFVDAHRVELEQVAPVAAGPCAWQLEVVSNKARFAEYAAAHGLPHPRTVPVSDPISFPQLLKPACGDMGSGIRLVRNRGELGPMRGEWILQDYVPGTDLGCSVLCQDGSILAYTIQRGVVWRGKRPYTPPIGVEFIRDDEALNVVRRLIACLAWNGVANIDLRCDSRDGHVKILELNGRYWATMLGSQRAGINFPELACRLALGQNFELPLYSHGLRSGGALAYFKQPWRMSANNATFHVALADPLPVLAAGRLARMAFGLLKWIPEIGRRNGSNAATLLKMETDTPNPIKNASG